MELQEYNKLINEKINSHKGDYIGLHDCHLVEIAPSIMSVGLCVSYNPYGKKVRRFMDADGTIDLDKNFVTTMYHLSKNNQEEYVAKNLPVCPFIISIPKEILDIVEDSCNNEFVYEIMCNYGFQERPKEIKLNNGERGFVRGDIKLKPTSKGANVRVLPLCFVEGYYDMSTGKFVENPKHYSKLPKQEQTKIKRKIKKIYENYKKTKATTTGV